MITKDYFLDFEINRMKKIVVAVAAQTLYYLPLRNQNSLTKKNQTRHLDGQSTCCTVFYNNTGSLSLAIYNDAGRFAVPNL